MKESEPNPINTPRETVQTLLQQLKEQASDRYNRLIQINPELEDLMETGAEDSPEARALMSEISELLKTVKEIEDKLDDEQ